MKEVIKPNGIFPFEYHTNIREENFYYQSRNYLFREFQSKLIEEEEMRPIMEVVKEQEDDLNRLRKVKKNK